MAPPNKKAKKAYLFDTAAPPGAHRRASSTSFPIGQAEPEGNSDDDLRHVSSSSFIIGKAGQEKNPAPAAGKAHGATSVTPDLMYVKTPEFVEEKTPEPAKGLTPESAHSVDPADIPMESIEYQSSTGSNDDSDDEDSAMSLDDPDYVDEESREAYNARSLTEKTQAASPSRSRSGSGSNMATSTQAASPSRSRSGSGSSTGVNPSDTDGEGSDKQNIKDTGLEDYVDYVDSDEEYRRVKDKKQQKLGGNYLEYCEIKLKMAREVVDHQVKALGSAPSAVRKNHMNGEDIVLDWPFEDDTNKRLKWQADIQKIKKVTSLTRMKEFEDQILKLHRLTLREKKRLVDAERSARREKKVGFAVDLCETQESLERLEQEMTDLMQAWSLPKERYR